MTIPKVNLGLIFFLFVLFAGMNFAAPDYTISECGRFANPGLYELTADINTGYINTSFEDPTDHKMCAGDYLTWQTCNPDTDPLNCTVEAAAYEACIDLNGYEDPQTACLQFRAIGGLGTQSIVLDCKGHKITTDVDYGILVYEPFAVLRYGVGGSYWTSISQNVEIRNCYVENSQTGAITLIDVRNTNITNNTVINNAPTETFAAGNILGCSGGITLLNSFYSEVTNNTAINNTFGICVARSTPRDTIYDPFSRENRIYDNLAYNNRFTGFGIAGGSYDNNVTDNTFTNNTYGLIIGAAFNNTFRDLNVSNNKYIDFAGDPIFYSDYFCQNYIDGSHGAYVGSIDITEGEKLYFYNESVTLIGDGVTRTLPTSEIIVCADNVNVSSFVLQGIPSKRNNGLFVMGDNLKVNGLDASNVMVGLYTQLSDNIIVQNSTFTNNKNGIMLNSITNVDISRNMFTDNTATGIVGATSFLSFFEIASGSPPTYAPLSYIDIYNNEFTGSGDGTSVRDVYPGAFEIDLGMGSMFMYPGEFLDIGTGSATSLFFAHNVTYYDNVIDQSSTYGFVGVLVSDSEIYENEITNILGTTAYEITSGGFFEVMGFDEMLAFLPGTGIVFDGSLTNITSNNMSSSINGYISLPFTNMFSGFGLSLMPPGPNYVYGNEIFDNTLVGFGLIGPTIFHSNFVYNNNYTLAINEGSYVFNNFFNNTNEIFSIEADTPNYFNITLTPGTNIIGGDTLGGNFWGKSDGLGYSQYCLDGDDNGICDDPNPLTGTLGSSNNTDYFPLALSSGAPPPGPDECIDLNDVISLGEVNNEYGHVTDYNNVLYINNDTTICEDVYTTTRTGVYMYMNGSYSLDGSNSRFISSSSGDLIGILNYNDGVTIKNCQFSGFTKGVVSTPNPATTPLDYSVGVNLFNSVIESDDEESDVYVADPVETALGEMYLYDLFVDNAVKVGNNLFFTNYYYEQNFYDLSDFSESYQSEGRWNYYAYLTEFLPLYDDCAVIITNYTHMSMVSCDGTDLGNDLWGGSPGIDNPGQTIIELIQNPNNGYVYRYDSYLDYTNDSTYKAEVMYFKTDLSEFGSYEFEGLTGLFIPTLTIDQDDNVIVMFKNDSASYLYKFNETLSLLDNTTLSAHNPYTKSIFSDYENDFIYELSTTDHDVLANESILKLQRYTFDGTIDITEDISLDNFTGFTVQAFSMSKDGTTFLIAGHSKTENNNGRKIFVSNDSGENWFETGPGGVDDIYWQTAYVSYDGQYILIGTYNSYNLYLSEDKGLTWEETPSDTFTAEQWFALHVSDNGQLMYAKYSDGAASGYNLTRSTDGGSTWENIIITNDRNLSTYLENGNILFANDGQTILLSKSGKDDIYYSTDNGTTFHNLTTIPALEVDQNWVTASISEDGENIILGYTDAAAGRIYLSNDSGATFNLIKDAATGAPIEAPWSQSSISEDGQYIIIAASGVPGKAYFSSDYGARWNSVSLPYAAAQVLGVFVAADEDLFYIFGMNGMDDYIYIFNPAGSIEETLRDDVAMGSTNVIFSDDATKFIFKQDSPLIGIIGDLSLLEGQGPITKEYDVSKIYSGYDGNSRDMNFLFDGEYFYYVANDIRAGNERLYYKVFNLTLDEVATGEFKPYSGEVGFAAYLNNETGNLEFIGTFNVNTKFYAYLDKDNEFEFNLVYPSEDYPFELQYYEGEFVEVDSVGNSVVVGVNKTSRVSTVNVRVFDSEGNLTSNNDYTMDETTYSVPHDFIIDSEGNYVVSGLYFNSETYNYTYFIMVINSSNGELIGSNSFLGLNYGSDASNYYYIKSFLYENSEEYGLVAGLADRAKAYNISKDTLNYSEITINGKIHGLDYNDENVTLLYGNGPMYVYTANISNISQSAWAIGPVSVIYNNIYDMHVYIDSQGLVYYTDCWYDSKYLSSVYVFNQTGGVISSNLNNPQKIGKIRFDESDNIYMWHEKDDVYGIGYMDSGNIDYDDHLFTTTRYDFVTFDYNNGKITTLDYDNIYINETSVYRDLIKNYNVNEDGATLVWSYDYLEEYFDGSLVSYDSILIGITPIDSNYYVGALINVVFDPFTNSMLDSSVDFYKVTIDGEVTKWFDFDESLMYPSYMKYINGKLYVIMGYSENLGMDDSSTFFSGRYYLYEFDNNGDYEIIPIPEYYSLATPAMFEVPVAYDPSGYMIIAGSPLGPEVDMGGTVINLLPALNLTKVRLSDGEIMWNKQITYFDSPINWGRSVNVVDDGYLVNVDVMTNDGLNPTIIKINSTTGEVLWNQTILNGSDENLCNWEDLEMDVGNGFAVSNESIYAINYTEGIGLKLLKSTNGGDSWTNIFSNLNTISEVATSADGSKVLAVTKDAVENYTLYSTDYGETSVNVSYADTRYHPRISGDGNVLLVSAANGTLYKSTNGVDWAPIFVTGPTDYPFGYEISYNGQIIFYSFRNETEGTDNLLLSEDGGTNWVSITPDDTSYKQMPSCAITNDGTKAVMSLTNTDRSASAIYEYNITAHTFTNIDSEVGVSGLGDVGILWTPTISKRVDMSGDGETIMVSEWTDDPEGDDGELYISTDAGVSWNELYPTNSDVHNWYQMALSNDGNVKLVSYRDDDGVSQLYLLNGDQVCEETFVGEPYDLLTSGSYLVEETDDDLLFATLVNLQFDEFVTVTINGTDGMLLDSLPYPYLGGVNYNDYFHVLTFDMGDKVGYSKMNRDLMTSSLATSAEITGMISSEDSNVMGFYPTSYGVILIGIYNDVPAFMGYAFQKSYSSSLSGVLIENIGIFNSVDGVRNIDLTSGAANTTDLVIGCTGFTCSISFSDIGDSEATGYLRNGENVYLNPYFVSLNPRDANANIFNRSATIRLALPPDATTPWIVRADGFYGTRADILRYGTNIGPATILEDSIGRYVEFDIDGWSSYTLGYVIVDDDGSDEDMFFDYESEMCIGETYAINVWDKFDDPIKNALVTIHYPDGDSMESRTKLEGNILFTPQLEGVYRLDAQGPSGYDDIKLSANHQFTARDCSLSEVCPDPTKENYILVVDNPPFDCQYACSITECPEGMDLVDDSLGCRCALLICPDPEENYRFVINDPPTCTYECAIDQAYCDTLGEGYTFNSGSCTCELGDLEEVELVVVPEYEPDPNKFDLKEGQVCTGGAFTFDVISGSADFLLNAMVSVFDENGVKIYENVDLSELQPLYSNGTYTFVVSSPGYKTSRLSVEIVDCPEPDIEEPIITPVESSFWDDIINILRTSIKGGCEGFYFEGIPTILCDLVWVVVIIGSIGAAYLEPLKSRKVISLFTPSVVAIILIPLMGAIAAAVVVYLAYNSKKHVEGKLGHEKEQMEEEIQKD